MKFFSPIPQLIRRTVLNGNDKFFLQVTTYCDQFNYKYASDAPTTNFVDENDILDVNITILKDDDLPINATLLPLTHHILLPTLPEDRVISVNITLVVENQGNPQNNGQPQGVVTISTADADEEARPIEVGSFG